MNISLLDVLSCGLAAMVILLLLSLNTGIGDIDNVDENTAIEISLLNFKAKDEVSITTPIGRSIKAKFIPSLLQKSVSELTFKGNSDSLNKFVYFVQQNTSIKQNLFIQLSKGASKFGFKLYLENIKPGHGEINIAVTKSASEKPKPPFSIKISSAKALIELQYNNGVRVVLDTLNGSNSKIYKSF